MDWKVARQRMWEDQFRGSWNNVREGWCWLDLAEEEEESKGQKKNLVIERWRVVPKSPMAHNAHHNKVQIRPAGLKGLHNLISFPLNSHFSPSQKSTLVSCYPLKSMFIPDIFNHVSLPQLAYQGPSPPKSYSSFKVWLKSHLLSNLPQLLQTIPSHSLSLCHIYFSTLSHASAFSTLGVFHQISH